MSPWENMGWNISCLKSTFYCENQMLRHIFNRTLGNGVVDHQLSTGYLLFKLLRFLDMLLYRP